MKMNKKAKILMVSASAVLLLVLLGRSCPTSRNETVLVPGEGRERQPPSGESPPSHAISKKEGLMASFLDAFNTPIELHGKVVDQHGDPVPGASVRLTPVDAPHRDSSGSAVTLISDAEGKFSIKGLHGFSMGVSVSKEGYLHLSPLGGPASSAMVSYAQGAEAGKRHSNPDTPLVLTLHKVGPVEPMVYVDKKRWRLPVDGSPIRIALDSEEGIGSHQIEFRFKSDWNQLPMDNEINLKLFDWTFEAHIPGGGFIWNDSDYHFEAPESGYKETIRYHHPASQPREKWKRSQRGRYFVKFSDGTHARIEFSIDGGSDRRPLYMASWMNLKPGSRNLASPEKDGSGFHGGNPEEEQ